MKISESTFTIVANGFADGPAQPLRDYLIKHKAKRVITIFHPLVPEGDNHHIITEYSGGKKIERKKRLPNKPPYTFIFDPFVPWRIPKTSAWIAFNNLAAYRGLMRKKRGKADRVFYWAVDFVANRFGNNPMTIAYDYVDKVACQKVDGRAELSEVGVTSRNRHHHLKKSEVAPTQVIPMGAWVDNTPKISASAWNKKKLIYMGHLVERQGVESLVRAMAILNDGGHKCDLEIVGAGPELEKLQSLSKELGVDKLIKFHGFVKDFPDVEKILASGTLAVAPYKKEKNFVQFTDAGKLKAYLGAGLPIVLTDVPNNAQELQSAGVAFIAEDDPEDLAKTIEMVLYDKAKWQKAQAAVTKKALEFDWNIILKKALKNFGYE